MTVLPFPTKDGARPPRLLSEEKRLQLWYEALDWAAQDGWYTLHELRAATAIPLARLPTILWRCGVSANWPAYFSLARGRGQ